MTPWVLKKVIETDWAEQAEFCAACLAVVDYVHSTQELSHLTFGKIRRIVKNETKIDLSERDLVSLTAYLCRDDLSVLQVGFEFLDENEEIFPLSKEDISRAERERSLPHPITGDMIEDFKDQILIFFEPGERIER